MSVQKPDSSDSLRVPAHAMQSEQEPPESGSLGEREVTKGQPLSERPLATIEVELCSFRQAEKALNQYTVVRLFNRMIDRLTIIIGRTFGWLTEKQIALIENQNPAGRNKGEIEQHILELEAEAKPLREVENERFQTRTVQRLTNQYLSEVLAAAEAGKKQSLELEQENIRQGKTVNSQSIYVHQLAGDSHASSRLTEIMQELVHGFRNPGLSDMGKQIYAKTFLNLYIKAMESPNPLFIRDILAKIKTDSGEEGSWIREAFEVIGAEESTLFRSQMQAIREKHLKEIGSDQEQISEIIKNIGDNENEFLCTLMDAQRTLPSIPPNTHKARFQARLIVALLQYGKSHETLQPFILAYIKEENEQIQKAMNHLFIEDEGNYTQGTYSNFYIEQAGDHAGRMYSSVFMCSQDVHTPQGLPHQGNIDLNRLNPSSVIQIGSTPFRPFQIQLRAKETFNDELFWAFTFQHQFTQRRAILFPKLDMPSPEGMFFASAKEAQIPESLDHLYMKITDEEVVSQRSRVMVLQTLDGTPLKYVYISIEQSIPQAVMEQLKKLDRQEIASREIAGDESVLETIGEIMKGAAYRTGIREFPPTKEGLQEALAFQANNEEAYRKEKEIVQPE